MYDTYILSQKWDSVIIWHASQWNKNLKKSTIFNILRTLISHNNNNAEKSFTKTCLINKQMITNELFWKYHFRKIFETNRATVSSIIWIIVKYDMQSCYKNIFAIRTFRSFSKTSKKKKIHIDFEQSTNSFKACHTDALPLSCTHCEIASMALPAKRERLTENVWHIVLRMLYVNNPIQKFNTIRTSVLRDIIKIWNKLTTLKVSNTYILDNDNAEKLNTKKSPKKLS